MNDKNINSQANEYKVPRRAGIWVLLTSLLVNFFMLGLVVAPMLRPHPPFPPFGPHGGFVDNLTRDLPPADAAILRDLYAKEEPILTAGHKGTGDAMQEVAEALRKPEVDPNELQRALADVTAAHGKVEEAMSDLINQAAMKLSPEGRRAFAEHGLRPPEHGPFGGGHHDGPPPMMGMPPSDHP